MQDQSNKEPKDPEFDQYANQYRAMLSAQNNFFTGDRNFIYDYRAELIAKRVENPAKILDFGCGIGINFKHLQKRFPNAKIFGSDVSTQSMAIAKAENPFVTFILDEELKHHKFDFILIAGVFHHIAPAAREEVMNRLSRMLNPQGVLCIYEHNPYNPVTMNLVKTCEFDDDAVLLTLKEVVERVHKVPNFSIIDKGYYLFIPPSLAWLKFIERFIHWLPLGGQHYVFVRNTD